MKLREYQKRAVDFLQPRKRAFIVAPAGSGKTAIAASAAVELLKPFDAVCVLVNTREQREQMYAAMKQAKLPACICLDVYCVAAQPDVSGYDLIIIDECHHLPARTWWTTVATVDCAVWGFSATPWTGNWERDGVLKAFFGEDNFLTIDRSEVMNGGSIVGGQVIIHDLDQFGIFDGAINALAEPEAHKRFKKFPQLGYEEHYRRSRWKFTTAALQINAERNRKIIEIAKTEHRSVLILVASIDHGEVLEDQIAGSVLVYSKLSKKKRAAAIEGFKIGVVRVMIATSLADEGLDVPRASVLILAAGGRSPGKLEQRAGRVMRPHEGKEFGVVHDFEDCGAAIAHNQFKSRVRTYKKLGYTIQ